VAPDLGLGEKDKCEPSEERRLSAGRGHRSLRGSPGSDMFLSGMRRNPSTKRGKGKGEKEGKHGVKQGDTKS